MRSTPFVGTVAGTAPASAAWFGGFGAFLLVGALGALGWAVGRWVDGGGRSTDVRDLFERSRR
ncbi:hypothetical protein JS756_05010 [Streptomyces actuosus]|uniref:Uncharacterized protein n=1 Tax=Streptomyces actuosus TaxID=1885 RepID=A0ABS2VK46_STRAS|nr:hypothetical protein [Streptomyces actuosus]MBN0043471.1 hypothetical protein [Streptomyces actuosus]